MRRNTDEKDETRIFKNLRNPCLILFIRVPSHLKSVFLFII